jgi:uncharacterized protein
MDDDVAQMTPMKTVHAILGIFAKQPIRGQAKTRLAQATSAEWAERVATAFLGDTLDRFAALQAHRAIVYAPTSASKFFTTIANQRYDTIPQSDGDLGQRLSTFFRDARATGFHAMVAIGTDSPTLPVAYVEQAFVLLTTHDFVVGPACDGGYYLIGTSCDDCSIFDDIPWSTPRVLESTISRVRARALTLAVLPPWYDVDTVDDWNMLRGHVLAIRQSDVDPGVPRLEQLIQEELACRMA